jgi:hypothetical protein
MKKRGRPAKHGMQDATQLHRALEALLFFHKFRKAGEKYWGAVFETVNALRHKHKISQTAVKRSLRRFQPSGARTVLTVSKPVSDEKIFVPGIGNIRRVLQGGFGPRPKYPR